MFVWRTKNVWCLESIPAELEAVTETIHDIKADNNRVFFKESTNRLKNKECVHVVEINTCWTWLLWNCSWHQRREQWVFFKDQLRSMRTSWWWYCIHTAGYSKLLKLLSMFNFQKRKCTRPIKVQSINQSDDSSTPQSSSDEQNRYSKLWRQRYWIDVIKFMPAKLPSYCHGNCSWQSKQTATEFSSRRALSLGEQRMLDVLN